MLYLSHVRLLGVTYTGKMKVHSLNWFTWKLMKVSKRCHDLRYES